MLLERSENLKAREDQAETTNEDSDNEMLLIRRPGDEDLECQFSEGSEEDSDGPDAEDNDDS